MISPEYRAELQNLKNTSYGIALEAFLNEKLDEIRDLSTIKTLEELHGRRDTEKFVKELLSIINKQDTKDSKKNQYV